VNFGENLDWGVVGGGIVGLACAWRLAQHGARVVLLERGKIGGEASFVAAGMLAAQCENAFHPPSQYADELFRFCLRSRALYPDFLAELQVASGLSLARERGICAVPSPQTTEPFARLQAQKACGLAVEKCEYGRNVAYWLPDEGAVDPREIVRALALAARSAGVAVFENSAVDWTNNELRANGNTVRCERVLICGGAWSSGLLGEVGAPDDWISPVAGLVLATRPAQRLHHVVYSSDVYLVPRADGRVIIGATSEDWGFDKHVSLAAARRLMNSAARLMPELEEAPIEEMIIGLRPVSRDGLPFIGPISERVYVAAGHGRNGVLLAPATATLVGEAASGGNWNAAFSPERILCASH
jgi:glycine oxidase